MSWFDKVLDAVQTAAVIGERVERLGNAVGDLAKELREMDRRLSRLEGAYAVSGSSAAPSDHTASPRPKEK
ncbi:MAG: hypothetical protein ACE5GS_16280 [Kiloniellaceae bacterium]